MVEAYRPAVLGDPFSRLADAGAIEDLDAKTPPGQLDDGQLRRRLANIDMMLREAAEWGTKPSLVVRLRKRWIELWKEYDRRGMTPDLPREWTRAWSTGEDHG